MQISVHADIKSTKRGIFRKNFRKEHSRGQTLFGIQLQTLPWLCKNRKLLPDTWNKKYSMHKNRSNYIYQNDAVKGKL